MKEYHLDGTVKRKSKTTFKWVVEIELADFLVIDGFEMTQEKAQHMVEELLPYAYAGEVKATIKKSPSRASINKAIKENEIELEKESN